MKNKIILITLFFLTLFTISCKTTSSGVYHKVEKGDTLSNISLKYGIDKQKLMKENFLNSDEDLSEGNTIFISGVTKNETFFDLITPGKEKETHDSTEKKDDTKKSGEKIDTEFIWPVSGKIVTKFGSDGIVMQEGINISVPEKTAVKCAAGGKVLFAKVHGGYGKTVIIQHDSEFLTIYAHNSELFVKEGEIVKRGKKIAESGKSGKAEIPQLHFEIRKNSKPVDPEKYLPSSK